MENKKLHWWVLPVLGAAFLVGVSSPATGQMSNLEPEQTRHGFQEGIDTYPGLSVPDRQTMERNLDSCLDRGFTHTQLSVLFPEKGSQWRQSGSALLSFQNRVLGVAEDDLPVEPILAKIQEGRIKRVPEQALEKVCVRMDENLHAARRFMTAASADGLAGPGGKDQEHQMVGEVAQHLWRGMNGSGLAYLGGQARQRLADGECGMEDLVWGSEVATRLHEEGVDLDESVRLVGDALRRGYRAPQMRELRFMVATRRGDRAMGEFLGDMDHCIARTMTIDEMYDYMMQHGWMGPGDRHSPGGQHPMDDVGGGPGRHGGMGDGHHGGGGDDDHHGGDDGGGGHGGGG